MLSYGRTPTRMMSATIWLTTTTAFACDGHRTSPTNYGESTSPVKKPGGVRSAVPVSTALILTEALVETAGLQWLTLPLHSLASIRSDPQLSVYV